MAKKRLIIDLGYPRTGTRSLVLAFEALGFDARHGPPPRMRQDWLRAMLMGSIDTITRVFDDHEYLGQLVPTMYRQIHERYPEALFILPMRDATEWIGAVRRWHYAHKTAIRPERDERMCESCEEKLNYRSMWKIALFGSIGFHKETWAKRYADHCNDVQRFTGTNALVLDVFRCPDPWQEIQRWLANNGITVKVPDRLFPHVKRRRLDLTEVQTDE